MEERSAERRLRRRIRTSLTDWAVHALPDGQVPARHHRLMIDELERVAAGRCDRLMVLMPPGSAKSTYAVLNVLLGTLGAMATSVWGIGWGVVWGVRERMTGWRCWRVLSKAPAERLYSRARLRQRGIIGGVADTDVGAHAEGAAVDDGDVGFGEKG